MGLGDGANEGACYRPSGKPGRAIVALPVGIAAAALLSIAYGYVSVFNPLAGVISFLIPLVYGAALGFVLARVNRTMQCRSVGLAAGVGALCGLAGVYFGWAAFIYAFLNHYVPGAAPTLAGTYLNPPFVWNTACAINAVGWFTVKGSTPSGVVLWVFWAGEVVTIVWTTYFLASDWIKETVFCEGCMRWSDKTNNIARFAVTEDPQALAAFASGDLTPLAKLAPAHTNDPIYLRVDAQRCAACRETAGVSVVQVTTKKNEKGADQLETKALATLVLMTQDLLDGFQAAAAQSAQAVKQEEAEKAATKEERLKSGQLDEHERRESIRMALAAVDPEIKKQADRFDKPAGTGCAWSLAAGVACIVLGLIFSGTTTGIVLMCLMGAACAAAGIYSVVMIKSSQKRYVKQEVHPRLVLTLQPLKPTREELDAALTEATSLGYAAGTLLKAEQLHADIQTGGAKE
jgi:hypothetical protein